MNTRKNYQGLFRKLVIAFDVGTTFSGASYAILDPGLPPKIEGVTSFPAQGKVGGDSKIPSIIYYDQAGEVRAVGTEATEEAFLEQADDEDFIKVEWFKLHMRPKHLHEARIRDADYPPLPPNKTVIEVFSDFLRYLSDCTIKYIKEHVQAEFFASIGNNIDYVLTHPNGWEGAQQTQMRQAAICAGLVSAHDADARIQFVTEGEASLHYCINKGVLDKTNEEGIIIVDAGGGTIDLSAYQKSSEGGFTEIAKTQCRLQGSIYVTARATGWLQEKLKDSRYGTRQDIAHMSSVFDKTTKLSFRNNGDGYIPFGSARDKDPKVDIKMGRMKVPVEVMRQMFAPSIQAIVEAIQEQRRESDATISSIYLVGGFAASDWLFSNLQQILTQLDLSLHRPDGFVNKAVADGAVSFYLDRFVIARVARFTFGVECVTAYDSSDPEHRKRSHTTYLQPSGRRVIPGCFDPILLKGTKVEEETEFRQTYDRETTDKDLLRTNTIEILCYRGLLEDPRFLDADPKMFSTLCDVEIDIPETDSDWIHEMYVARKRKYYTASYDMVLLFGPPETKAQISWKENGVEKRSSAAIVYDQVGNGVRA